MGVGKTSLYHLLKTEYHSFDLDLIIEKENGNSCQEIIKRKGIKYFRELEFQSINLFSKSSPHLLFLGAGAQTEEKTMALIQKCYTTIYLEEALENILKRLTPHEKKKRPLFEQASKLFPERVLIYQKSDIIITCHEDIHITANKLRKVLT